MAGIFYIKGDNAAEAHRQVIETLKKKKLYSNNLLYRTFDGIRIPTLLKTGNDRGHADFAGVDFLLSDNFFGVDIVTDFAARPEDDNPIPLPDKETIEAIKATPVQENIEDKIYASTGQDIESDALSAWSLTGKYEQPAIAVYDQKRFNKTCRYEYTFKSKSKKSKLKALVAVFTVGWKYKQPKKK
jgi:hypothetical protein